MPFSTAIHPWEIARIRVVRRILESWLSQKRDICIADIGCGEGFVSAQLGYLYPHAKVYGIDTALGTGLAPVAHPENVVFLKDGALLPSHVRADLILVLDVLEHVRDEAGFLKELGTYTHAKEPAHCLFTAPAFPCLFSNHDRAVNHERRYTRCGLVRLLEQNGFRVTRSGYFFISLLLPRIAQITIERIFKPAPNSPKWEDGNVGWKHGKTLQWLISAALTLDYSITATLERLGLSLPGLSCYAIATLPALR